MQTVDALIIGIAVVAVLGTIGGVVYYEPSEVTAFDVTFDTAEADGPDVDFSGTEGSVNINATNLTKVVFEFTATLSGGAPLTVQSATFDFSVKGPGGAEVGSGTVTVGTGTARSGTTTVEVTQNLCAVPEAREEVGADAATVAEAIASDTVCLTGNGPYTVDVTATNVPPGSTASYAGTTALTTYLATITPQTPEVSGTA